MLGRAQLEEIHLLRDTGRDWRGVRGKDRRFVKIQRDQVRV